MLQEPQEPQASHCDLSIDSHAPASAKSQDISPVLASIFKELYKEVTPCNLIKTKGRSSFHDRYIEELQQVRAEYNRCINEANMLESHIIQARARAAATERQALERMKEQFRDVEDLQALPSVKSAFIWHIDEGLLQTNNLLSPLDYLTPQKIQMKAPAVAKPDLTRPTIAYTMHTQPDDMQDGWGALRKKERKESEPTQTLDCSSVATKCKMTSNESKPRPKWKDEPSAKDRAEGFEKLQKMKERQRILQNPRFLSPKTQGRSGTSLIHAKGVKKDPRREEMGEESPKDNPVQVFLANPPVVLFSAYSVGRVYETTLELKNVTSSCRDVRVIPPNTSYFTIGLGRFPGEGGTVAPGMSCKFTARFAPDSLGDYEDFIVVESQGEHLLVVPLEARRPPPVLTLPSVLDCGYCLIGGVKCVEFQCQNVGLSAGTFCIIPKNQWPATNPRLVVASSYSDQPPFAISPSFFALQPGEATVVEVVFFPTTTEKSCELFTIVCDNCQVKHISVQGEGQLIALELLFVSGKEQPLMLGEVHDITADHFIRFDSCNPHSGQHKKVVIRNNVHLELPFHWQVMKPNLLPLLLSEIPDPSLFQYNHDKDDVFHVSPVSGILAPCQDREFKLAFCPKEMQDYHSVLHLVLSDVPQLPLECDEGAGVLQPVRVGSKVGDATVMEIEVKGSTEPFNILLEPYAVVIPGELFIFTTTRRLFKMWNHSKTSVFFQWEKMSSSCHKIEVVPSAGKIEEKECCVFNLIVTGGKAEKVVCSLLCHIQHRNEPVALAVEVTFKGPSVTINTPSVDFSLIRLGEQSQMQLYLNNPTHLEASWTLEEVHKSQDESQEVQLFVEPCRGVLPPLAGCNVDILFRPQSCQVFETELELAVENGTGCHLLVRADVQSPQLCLLNCELLLPELYMGIAAQGTVSLFNQTLLTSSFSWMDELKGQQASLCSATFDPASGTLGPNASLEITVTFVSNTDASLNDVIALCEVEGMTSPLVLSILAPTTLTLRVSYSLPGVRWERSLLCPNWKHPLKPLLLSPLCACSPASDEQPQLMLDFGGDVVLAKPVTKQLLMTNHTAIPATFTIQAEYFYCQARKATKQPEKRPQYMKKPLHSVQAKKLEDQSHKDFVNDLLANGKGAAFYVLPSTGTLEPFETQTVDVTAYSGMWGEYSDHLVCCVGDLEPTLIPMQMTVKGCPLYFQIIGPRPDGQTQGPNVQFGTRVSGGDTVSRSLRINNPTMFDIRLDWETYNVIPNDRRLVDVVMSYGESFPLKDVDGNEILKEAPGLSKGEADCKSTQVLSSEATSASLPSSPGPETEEGTTEDRNGLCTARKKILSIHIRPHVGDKSEEPYCVIPQQIVIPAQGSSTAYMSFTPLTLSGSTHESKCLGLALGYISLDSETAACIPGKVRRIQGLDLEPIRVDLLAVVKPAVLLVQMEDDGDVLEFQASAGDLLSAEADEVSVQEFNNVQTVMLKNTTDMPLRFKLRTQPPFSVPEVPPRAGPSTSGKSSNADANYLLLHPQNSTQVRVSFRCSLSLLDHAELPKDQLPAGVALVHSESGYRQLRFQEDLLIHFNNNSLQTVPLCAHLKLASLRLSTDTINFGLCLVGQTQTKEVKLYSDGSHTHWKARIVCPPPQSHLRMTTTPTSSASHPALGSSLQRMTSTQLPTANVWRSASLPVRSRSTSPRW
ncbi:deleted in lung and esophageal cancer protein 1 isoform X2 [Dunckerocampus dactyliophorus]|uniref:deleted in lung and esophageal cancer protein 1 isoform X2 n=1 Tax=Dunckerocampus dactyliophorus TaxID=161453 RepID=UPI002404E6DB|nr:deleted in lung and esophageal cancer protein 1 isoform X2 [Dunckerocampus dactyliophorus]